MWNNRCRWVRARLPLLAGGDLIGLERRRVERHLHLCPACRALLSSYREALQALQAAAERPASSADAPSVWPALAQQIRESRPPVSATGWGWAAAGPRALAWSSLAVAASLLAAAWIVFPRPPHATHVPAQQAVQIVTAAPPPKTSAQPPPAKKHERAPKEALAASESAPPARSVSEPERNAAELVRDQPSN